MNAYEVLGISCSASLEEIDDAFLRRLGALAERCTSGLRRERIRVASAALNLPLNADPGSEGRQRLMQIIEEETPWILRSEAGQGLTHARCEALALANGRLQNQSRQASMTPSGAGSGLQRTIWIGVLTILLSWIAAKVGGQAVRLVLGLHGRSTPAFQPIQPPPLRMSWDDLAARVQQANGVLPDMMSDELRADAITAGDHTITYHYTLITSGANGSIAAAIRDLKPTMRSRVCADASLVAVMAQYGAVIWFEYSANDGRNVGAIKVEVSDCH